MKFFVGILALVACSLAAEAPYSAAGSKPQGALLLLPLQQANATNTTTPKPDINTNENLDEVNARLVQRLQQEQGSQQGQYHVYLEDGRLQRVQYTTAPIRPGQQQQQGANYEQGQQTPEILSPEFAGRRGVYFVQVPQERIQALTASYKQQVSQQNSQFSQAASAQYNEDQASSQPTVRYLPIQLPEDNSQYRQPSQQEPSGYLASVQYSQVEPIQGPVYSYKPQPLTRILRYAPVF